MGAPDGRFLPFSPNAAATERQAIRVKARLGLNASTPVDPYAVLRRVPARLLSPHEFPASVREVLFERQTGDWSAVGFGCSPTTGEALLLVNPVHHPHRQRASLMEEIVHVVLDHPKTEITLGAGGGGVWVRAYNGDVEDEAFSVGAACILPWPELFAAVSDRGESTATIAQRYSVSEAYARFRVQRAGLWAVYKARQSASA